MKILFLEIDTDAQWAVCSLGPAFLAATARAAGHEVGLYRVAPEADLITVVAAVRERAPDLLGMSLTTRQWLRGREVANRVKQDTGLPIIAGGLHPTFSPEETLAEPGFDAVCLGEGERPFLAFIDHLASGSTPEEARLANIWVRGSGRPSLGAPIDPIDAIPPLARDMLDERHGVIHMTTQRGCPFPCTYCAARMYDQLYEGVGAYGRRRSVTSVLQELQAICAEGPLNYVIFLDDTFTINHPWIFEFCDRFPREVGVPFSIHARAETMNPKLIAALADAGCRHIVYGVESGSERLRREVMKRPVSNDRLVAIFEATKKTGILVTANYMLGLPGETRAELQATLDLHQRLQPIDFGYFVFYPFPGTQLFEVCRQRGFLPPQWLDLPARHDRSILNLPDLTQEDIATAYQAWGVERDRLTAQRMKPQENTLACQ